MSFLSPLHEILDADNLDLMRRFALDHGFGDSSPRLSWHIAVGLEQHGVSLTARKYTSSGPGSGEGERKRGKENMSPSDLKTSHRTPSQGPPPQGPHLSHRDLCT